MAEWLRRWTANPLGFPRVGSNPILVVLFLTNLPQQLIYLSVYFRVFQELFSITFLLFRQIEYQN